MNPRWKRHGLALLVLRWENCTVSAPLVRFSVVQFFGHEPGIILEEDDDALLFNGEVLGLGNRNVASIRQRERERDEGLLSRGGSHGVEIYRSHTISKR